MMDFPSSSYNSGRNLWLAGIFSIEVGFTPLCHSSSPGLWHLGVLSYLDFISFTSKAVLCVIVNGFVPLMSYANSLEYLCLTT